MSRPEIVFVLARADNGVIGRDNALPWHLPADLRHFKAQTAGAPMIMGRRTFDSLGRVLPGRRHIVLTRDAGWSADGVEVALSPEDALARIDEPRVSVIGGAEIFCLFLGKADRIELTEVHAAPEGDVRMKAFTPSEWRETRREPHAASPEAPAYSFVTLVRRAS